jgi:hypothetical protein
VHLKYSLEHYDRTIYLRSIVAFFPTITKFEIILMPYFTRLIKMDFVRFEPTTSAPSSEHTYPKSN